MQIISIGSSSSGNSYIIKAAGRAIILDVGLSCKAIMAALEEEQIEPADVAAVLVTHEHVDHVKSVRAVSRKCSKATFYASRGTIESAAAFSYVPEERLTFISAGETFAIDSADDYQGGGDITITAFELSHDALEPIGYTIEADGEKLSVITDTGIIKDETYEAISDSDQLVFEANHDVDMLMFSVNPAYDYGHGEYANGSVDERSAVYRRCEKEGIGISVMKPFSGGQLLDAKQSPFGKALTQYQCIRYCLDKPGILTVLPGAQSVQEVKTLLAYYDQSEEATDYSVISSFTPPKALGKCVYCNHCKPCPVGIDIGLVNKYYDLALAGDAMAVEHYRTLEKNADDCVNCGHCDSRCPFSVKQSERMQEIRSCMAASIR